MNIRILGIVLLLLCTVFMVGIDRCDRSEASQPEASSPAAETVQADNSPSNQTPPPSERKDEDKGNDELTADNPNSSLSPREYGRENPFEPLVRSRPAGRGRTTGRSNTAQKKTTAKKPEAERVVRLTAILGENSAIFKENGADKSVSIGDAVGGMKVLEIRINEGKVVLSKGDEKLTIALGTQIKL